MQIGSIQYYLYPTQLFKNKKKEFDNLVYFELECKTVIAIDWVGALWTLNFLNIKKQVVLRANLDARARCDISKKIGKTTDITKFLIDSQTYAESNFVKIYPKFKSRNHFDKPDLQELCDDLLEGADKRRKALQNG